MNTEYKKIAVLSGKGGTGKTTVATNLAWTMQYDYIDLDVEEPNGHLFLKPTMKKKSPGSILNPVINKEKCTLCGACVKSCVFNALAMTLKDVLLFPELCHGCGACSLACPEEAICEEERTIGLVQQGVYEKGQFTNGTLNIKEPMAGPIISQIKKLPITNHTFFDCPPGTSCNVVKSLLDVDYALVITEETEFGRHDMEMVITLLREMSIPFSVIINKALLDNKITRELCNRLEAKVLGEIPESRIAATLYSKGEMLCSHQGLGGIFEELAQKVLEEVQDANCGA